MILNYALHGRFRGEQIGGYSRIFSDSCLKKVIISRTAILALPVMPLNQDDTLNKFSWLLEGSSEENRTLSGGSGLSPSLLHCIKHATYLAASLNRDGRSMVPRVAAEVLVEEVENLRQCSELSEGPSSAAELLRNCVLDDGGFVATEREMTELGGEAWKAAVQIYIECRVFR